MALARCGAESELVVSDVVRAELSAVFANPMTAKAELAASGSSSRHDMRCHISNLCSLLLKAACTAPSRRTAKTRRQVRCK